MQLNIGNKIRELRRRDGRTQEALAEALGVTGQAVSRWESGGSYPDMEIMPAIANYFGVTIDELFGYHNERSQKVDMLVSRIDDMNFRNNGVNINIDECISLAREAMIEFPGNEKIMLCLASVLYNAGYVRYGEYHLIDDEGYGIYDTERHRTYNEWKEAIMLYEKLLKTLEEGELRHRAIRELTQLYLNTGEHERAMRLVETAPSIYGSRELLRINACDGKKHAEAYGKAILNLISACANLMIGGVLANGQNMTPTEKVQSIRGAIALFHQACPDGNYGNSHSFIARMYTLLSLYLWLDGKRDEAFDALDQSLEHFKMFEKCCAQENAMYSAPLVRLVKIDKLQACANDPAYPHTHAASLVEDWPWWSVDEDPLVRNEIQADPRWAAWVAKTQA